MNLTLLIWIIIFFIVAELIFIYFLKIFDVDWLPVKLISMMISAFFCLVQIGIIYPSSGASLDFYSPRYINLLYEFISIAAVSIFFILNRFIAKKLQK